MSRVDYGTDETRDFDKSPETDKEDCVTHSNLSQSKTYLHT